jgi:hypothetical protein
MDYVIAIPSYKRHETLKKKTLRVLKEYNVPKKIIYVFVANKEENDLYNETLDKDSYNKLVVGKPGIKEIRNYMANYFDEGQKIVYMDDDIGKIWECKNDVEPYDKKNNKVFKHPNLKKFFTDAFKLSKKSGYHNWGVYPRDNPYFMKPTNRKAPLNNYVSTDLKFLIGFMTGVINNREAELRTIGDKEDYERTIKYYLKDGGVLRFNNISCYTRCYKVSGGIQATRKISDSNKNAKLLIKKYPNLVSVNNGRHSPFVEILVRDKTKLKSFNKSQKVKKSKKKH